MGIVLFISSLIIILLSRYFNIIIVSFIVNRYRTRSVIAENYRFILWFSGFRGAMAFALSLDSI